MNRFKFQLLLLLCSLGYSILANQNTSQVDLEKDNLLDPDLAPTLVVLPSTVAGLSSVTIIVTITELNNEDTDGSPIIVRIPSDPRLTFLSGSPNPNWNYLGNNGYVHSFSYNGPGGIITKSSQSSFFLSAMYDPNTTDGTTTITVSLVPFSGGDTNLTNSTDSETLVYFG